MEEREISEVKKLPWLSDDIEKIEDFDLERDVVLPKFSVPEEFYEKNDIKESQNNYVWNYWNK